MSEPLWQTLDRVTAKNKELCARIADLERQLAELTQENEAICAQNERFAEQLDELLRAQPTAQQVEDARDAARYRHMRARAKFMYRNGPGLYWYLPWNLKGNEGEQLDHTIDAALQVEKENGNE